jgi:glycine cleavage system pyridoxal-binding protein P
MTMQRAERFADRHIGPSPEDVQEMLRVVGFPTLDAMIDAARKQFQIEAPGADLLFSHPYEILTEQVTGGRLIG